VSGDDVSEQCSDYSGEDQAGILSQTLTEAKVQQVQVNDVEKIRISRDSLERWVDQAYFEETVVDCFVRMTFQSSKKQNEYMMCQIVILMKNNFRSRLK
jgi:hypothetical protein